MSIQFEPSAFAVRDVDPPRPDAPRTFASIQAGRGLAALMVVLFHADKLTTNPAYWHARAFVGALACGHAGVEFFFVLSGFIIAHVHRRDLGRPDRLGRYAAKRFDRIMPFYWLVLSGVVAVALLGPAVASLRGVDGAALVSSYLLAGRDSHGGVLTVSWTLFHEVLFYAAFALAIVDRRAGMAAARAWLALIVAGTTIGAGNVPAYVASPLNLLFAVGIAVEAVVRRGGVGRPAVWLAIGITAFVALAAEEDFTPVLGEMPRDLLYGLASAAALAGAVALERRRPLAVPRWLLTLGAASYSIYLVHYPLLSVVARGLGRVGLIAALPVGAGVVVLTGAVVAAGVAVHVAVERPLLAWLARRRRANAAAAKPRPTSDEFGRGRDRLAGRSRRESAAKPIFAEERSPA